MNDRELLELAAKVAGIEAIWNSLVNAFLRHDPKFGSISWNPLEDDGDALRLAVKLHHKDGFHVSHIFDAQFGADDPCAATRRAIVRAAAEIGKNQS